jgi:Putative peptidoglycan binding domain
MDVRVASIAVSLLVAGAPALAQDSSKKAAPAVAAKPVHGASHRKAAQESSVRTAEVPAAFAAIPDAERLAIQSDLVWLGGYEGMGAEEFDGHTVDAIKAFQRRHNGKETGVLSAPERAALAEAAKAPEAVVGWRLIEDTATGARLGLPEKLVPRAGAGRTGSRWTSAQGQVQIETFRLREASLPTLFEQEKKTTQRRVGFSALGSNSFVIAGEQRLKKFVVRAQSSGSEVRGVTILYDQATEGTMAPVAIAVSDTFQGFPDPNAGPLPGRSRAVEYGTAIVASSRGHLIALRHVTDQCQSITVPGFGHADRVAEDKTSDLALIRLYGARNLVPAALAGDNSAGDQLTLIGITDPLAQSGDCSVTTAAAHLTAQGLDPAPKLGFSGAAAVDAQGHFVGVADLIAPVVAGTTPVTSQATLIPAAAVRGFLQAQGITPAAGRGAMDQSVVRVICVRK